MITIYIGTYMSIFLLWYILMIVPMKQYILDNRIKVGKIYEFKMNGLAKTFFYRPMIGLMFMFFPAMIITFMTYGILCEVFKIKNDESMFKMVVSNIYNGNARNSLFYKIMKPRGE